MIGAGDLVEVVFDPKYDFKHNNPGNIQPGMRGVVISGVAHENHDTPRPPRYLYCELGHCVRFPHITQHIALTLLRKIQPPPADESHGDCRAFKEV